LAKTLHINIYKEHSKKGYIMVLIRFIINFILFGALFYLIWHFFPDTFTILVSWIKALVEFTQNLFSDLFNRISTNAAKKEIEPKTALGFILFFLK
jgi:hypothetical protein